MSLHQAPLDQRSLVEKAVTPSRRSRAVTAASGDHDDQGRVGEKPNRAHVGHRMPRSIDALAKACLRECSPMHPDPCRAFISLISR